MDLSPKGGLKAGGWRGLSRSSGLLGCLARAELGPGTLKSRGGAYAHSFAKDANERGTRIETCNATTGVGRSPRC
jgi:hypothetical protein